MDPLATVADVAARLGRPIAPEESPRVQAALDDASALIRGYCDPDFADHIGETVTLVSRVGAALDLPRFMRLIRSVDRVLVDGEPIEGWWLDGRSLCRAHGWRRAGLRVEVTASWGYARVPADVLAVCAAEVIRNLALSPGVASERVGDLEIEYAGGGSSGDLSLPARRALSRYRQRTGSVGVVRA